MEAIPLTVAVSGASALVALTIGYFKLLVPLEHRLTKLETAMLAQDHQNKDILNKLTQQNTEIVSKLDSLNNLLVRLTTTVWGEGGQNGMRSTLKELEGDVRELQSRMDRAGK